MSSVIEEMMQNQEAAKATELANLKANIERLSLNELRRFYTEFDWTKLPKVMVEHASKGAFEGASAQSVSRKLNEIKEIVNKIVLDKFINNEL